MRWLPIERRRGSAHDVSARPPEEENPDSTRKRHLATGLPTSGKRGLVPLVGDVEAVRLVLRGGSPIDWHRLNFLTLAEVDDFLRTNLLDPADPRDLARLQYSPRVHPLPEGVLRVPLPLEVRQPSDVRDLFLYASEDDE